MKWIKVFDSLEVAEAHFKTSNTVKVVVGTKELSLVRHNREYHAVSDVCPHQFESLSKGLITLYGEIVCPLHHYRFNLKTGQECQLRTKDLKTYKVSTKSSGLFVFC